MKLLMTSALAALTLGTVACTLTENAKRPEASAMAAPAAVAASEGVFPFKIGSLDAWALKDGDISLPVSGPDIPWKDPAVGAVLRAAGQPSDAVHLSIQPLLIRDGDRLVLIDTGAAGGLGTAGTLQASLRAAGVTADQITDVLISHAHEDHIGGLVTSAAAPAFANATIHVAAADWQQMKANPTVGAIVTAITPKVQPFAPGAVVTPNITAVALAGHTAGHTGYEIGSGADRLLYFGDALHSAVLSVAHPEFSNAWDIDSTAAMATRQSLLERAATQNLRLYGNHFPFPGVGHVQKAAQDYVWIPEPPVQR